MSHVNEEGIVTHLTVARAEFRPSKFALQKLNLVEDSGVGSGNLSIKLESGMMGIRSNAKEKMRGLGEVANREVGECVRSK